MKYCCLIVEDEPVYADYLRELLYRTGIVKELHITKSAHEALDVINTKHFDLLFLDLSLPGMSGLDLVKALPKEITVVATSNRTELAIDCYELGVIDFIKKPYLYDRLLLSISRILKHLQGQPTTPYLPKPAGTHSSDENLYVKIGKRIVRLQPSEIMFIQAYGIYCKIHTKTGITIINKQISILDKELEGSGLVRTHRSYLINPHYLSRLEAKHLWLGDKRLPIGVTYKDVVSRLLAELGLRPHQKPIMS